MQRSANVAKARAATRRPLLLRVAPWYFGFAALAAVLVLGGALLPGVTYAINDVPVTQEQFLAAVLPWGPLAGAVCGVLAWSFGREHLWARPTTIATFVLLLVGTLVVTSPGAGWVAVAAASLFAVALVTLLAWYFYRRAEVVRYYEDLRARRDRAGKSSIANAPQN